MFSKITNVATFALGLLFNVMIVAIVGYSIYYFANFGFRWGGEFAYEMVATGPDFEVEFVLPDYTSIREVARQLEEMGLVGNRWFFEIELFLLGQSRTFRPGTYVLNANMTNAQINARLRARPIDAAEHLVVRIPEGWTIANMAEYFEYREFFDADYFIYVAQHGHFNFTFLNDVPLDKPNRLEGFLFPNTYWVPLSPTPPQIIVRMLMGFEAMFDEAKHYRAEQIRLEPLEVVIMASIVEAEARHPAEMQGIAQVIKSRLAAGMRLEMPSTISYVQGIHRDALMEDDFLVDSPYNTFLFYGLPFGPISNPSEAAILAVLYPAGTEYLYFFRGGADGNELIFSAGQDSEE